MKKQIAKEEKERARKHQERKALSLQITNKYLDLQKPLLGAGFSTRTLSSTFVASHHNS